MKLPVKNVVLVVISVLVGTIIACLPCPEGLSQEALTYAGIFIGMLIAIISKGLPDWAAVTVACALCVLCNVAKIQVIFGSWSSSITWLILAAFIFSAACAKSGLMQRIAIWLLTLFPKNWRGQVLSLMAAGLVMAPVVPSPVAKAQIVCPMATAMTEVCGYEKKSRGAIGHLSAIFMPSYLGSYTFLTGSTNVAYMIGIMGLSFSYFEWLQLTGLWLVILLIVCFVYCMKFTNPRKSEQIDVPDGYFKEKLKELGAWKSEEKATGIILVLTLVAWVTNSVTKFDSGMICLVAIGALVLFNVLNTKDLSTKVPWNVVLFIGGIITLGNVLGAVGLSDWIAATLAPYLGWMTASVWLFVPCVIILTWLLRLVVPAQGIALIIISTIFAGLATDAGISVFVLCFVEYTCGQIWFTSYQNPLVLGAIAPAGNEYVTIREFRKTSIAYAVACIIGCFASIPIWSMMGFC
ncbi:MAG: SLC13 family permease [Clostridia bacterium]